MLLNSSLALAKAAELCAWPMETRIIDDKTPKIATTTKSSINVNPFFI